MFASGARIAPHALVHVRERASRAYQAYASAVWERRLDQISRPRAAGYRIARVLWHVGNGFFFDDRLHVRAAALTYFTVLSIVPLLAFAFALLKGFGAYDILVEHNLRPYLTHLFGGNPSLQTALEQILLFVQDTGVTRLGFFGLLALMYTASRLLHNIEEALNESWQVQAGRTLLKQLRDYAAIVLVAPLSLLLAAGMGTVGQLATTLQSVQEQLGMVGLVEWMAGLLGPIMVVTLALTALYMVMPNISVNLRSAAIGAIIGALLWYVMLSLHVNFQLGVARYNALYSSFAAIPIFLVWVYVSWLVVLIGAHIASLHQRDRTLALHKRFGQGDQARRELLGLASTLRVTRTFLEGSARLDLSGLATELGAQESVLREVLSQLKRAEILATLEVDGTYVLSRSPDRIRLRDVLDALRHARGVSSRRELESADARSAQQILCELDGAFEHSELNLSLRELVASSSYRRPSGDTVQAAEKAAR